MGRLLPLCGLVQRSFVFFVSSKLIITFFPTGHGEILFRRDALSSAGITHQSATKCGLIILEQEWLRRSMVLCMAGVAVLFNWIALYKAYRAHTGSNSSWANGKGKSRDIECEQVSKDLK